MDASSPADRLDALRDLISLTPLPARQMPVEIPFGEARGRFSISPQPNLSTAETEPGSIAGMATSTENSGGGLPSFGVFENLRVHTAYLDMRDFESDTAPSWTLEFGTPPGREVKANTDDLDEQRHEGLVLPFPTVKKRPSLPQELVRINPGTMVIVSGLINAEGRLEQLVVKASPNPFLNEPVIEALSQWLFRPALHEGEPVATKILLGVPLWLPK